MRRRAGEEGYTITELLVVLVILGLIAAAISPQILGRLDSSKIRAAKLQLDVVLSSLDAFMVDVGRYPTKEEGVEALLKAPADAAGWAGPYARSAANITDPWGHLIDYSLDEQGRPRIRVFGADGKEGGDGGGADIVAPEPIKKAAPGA